MKCPYCDRDQPMPEAREAGRLFGCPYCKAVYRFTGVDAAAVAQASAAEPAVEPAGGSGLTFGIALIVSLLAVLAYCAEIGLFFLFSIRDFGPDIGGVERLATFFNVARTVTAAVGILAPLSALAEMEFKRRNLGLHLLLSGIVLAAVGSLLYYR